MPLQILGVILIIGYSTKVLGKHIEKINLNFDQLSLDWEGLF
jgi:hypothetical protein